MRAGLVNVKVSRETHRLLLAAKGRMLADGSWSGEPTLDEVIATLLLERSDRAKRSATKLEQMVSDVLERLGRVEAASRRMR